MNSLSAEELKKLKRDASIKAKEDEFEKRRRDEEENKRKQLEDMKREYEEQEEAKKQKRIQFLQKQAQIKHEKEVFDQQRDDRRNQRIEKKVVAWKNRANANIRATLEAKAQEEEIIEQNAEEARDCKRAKEERIKQNIRDTQEREAEKDMNRDEKNAERHTQRELKEVCKVDKIKTEATEELESFIMHPYPVPLRQVLAGTRRPVPKVTELLACYKDQREDIRDLEDQDIPMRAQLRNQSIFTYVRDIQQAAEQNRLKPPEPIPSDVQRGGLPKPSPKSPKSKSPKSPSSPGRRR